MTNKFEIRPLALIVTAEGDAIFSETSTNVTIDDEAAGEFVTVVQPNRTEAGIAIDPSEWPVIRDAIDQMIDNCRRS